MLCYVIYLFEQVEVSATNQLMWTCYTHPPIYSHHNTGNFIPYSSRIVCGFFNVHRELMNKEDICETGPTVSSPYPR